ncbi:hypothetical protein BHM03_00004448 [Ensete ventricosum]|nr:hypothetical protein BHM03_00004448 [Ensete ventricosum]
MKISPWTLARLNAAAQARRKSKILQLTVRWTNPMGQETGSGSVRMVLKPGFCSGTDNRVEEALVPFLPAPKVVQISGSTGYEASGGEDSDQIRLPDAAAESGMATGGARAEANMRTYRRRRSPFRGAPKAKREALREQTGVRREPLFPFLVPYRMRPSQDHRPPHISRASPEPLGDDVRGPTSSHHKCVTKRFETGERHGKRRSLSPFCFSPSSSPHL